MYYSPWNGRTISELRAKFTRFSITVVSRIYAPRFATLVLAENVGGTYMRDLTFCLANTPPLPVPRLDMLDVHILQTDTEAGSTCSYTSLSRPPETRIPFGQDRLREVGHSVDGSVFQALPGFVRSMCCSIRTNTLVIDGEFLSCSVLPLHHGDLAA